MATASDATVKGIDVNLLTKDERMLCVASLVLKRASVMRAVKAEINSQVVEIRSREVEELNALIRKFS